MDDLVLSGCIELTIIDRVVRLQPFFSIPGLDDRAVRPKCSVF